MRKRSKGEIAVRLSEKAGGALADCVRELGIGAGPKEVHNESWDARFLQAMTELEGDPDPRARERLGRARASWALAQQTWWEMAQLAKYVAIGEAKKRISLLRYAGGLDFEDLVQIGLGGGFRAAQTWDPARESNFFTYCGWWIRAKILRAVHDDTGLSAAKSEEIGKIVRTIRFLEAREGRTCSVSAAARWLDLDPERSRLLLQASRSVSLDVPAGEDDDSTLGDLLADDPFDPTDGLDEISVRDQIEEAVRQLPERQQRIVRQRMAGLSLQDVADKLGGISRERVRQIENEAKQRLLALLRGLWNEVGPSGASRREVRG